MKKSIPKLSLFKERYELENGSHIIFESAEFFLNEIQKIDDRLSLIEETPFENEGERANLLSQLTILYHRIQLEALEHDKLNRKLKQLYLRLNLKTPKSS
jgi:hypothetical protein